MLRTADRCDEFPSPHGFASAEDHIGYQKTITFLDRELRRSLHASGQLPTSALGQKRTLGDFRLMSALPPKADMDQHARDVRFVPKVDILFVARRQRLPPAVSDCLGAFDGRCRVTTSLS